MAFDEAEMDMIRRGDMLGTKLGAKVANALETLQREREEAVARAEKAEAELSDTRETFSIFASLPRREQCNCLAPIIRYDGLGQTCAVCNRPARDDLSPKEDEE